MRLARILLRYAWASPATLVGLALAGIAGAFGATACVRKGVVEVAGGRLAGLAGSSGPLRLIAITLCSASRTAPWSASESTSTPTCASTNAGARCSSRFTRLPVVTSSFGEETPTRATRSSGRPGQR